MNTLRNASLSCFDRARRGMAHASIGAVILAGGILLVQPAELDAASQTRTTAGTAFVGDNSWSNQEANAVSINGSCANCNGGGGGTGFTPLRLSNYGFTIPGGATITGISVDVETSFNDVSTEDHIRLMKAAAPVGTNKVLNGDGTVSLISCGALPLFTVGSACDLWGTTWTPAEINAVGFGVQYQQSFANTSLDGVTITVFYDETFGDLTISKAGASPVEVGATFTWTLTVSNTAGGSAVFPDQAVLVLDNLPPGPSYTTAVAGNFTAITNSGNISCAIDGTPAVTCRASGGSVTIGASGSFTVTISASSATAGVFTNPATTCSVDPNDVACESNNANNACNSSAINVVLSPPTVAKAFVPNFAQPGVAISELRIDISNPNATTTAMDLAMTDTLPAGLELVTGSVVANTCGASVNDANPDTIVLGGTFDLAPGASCTVRVPVSAAAQGDYLNTTGPVTSSNVPPSSGASATLAVRLPLQASKAFNPTVVGPGGTTRLTVTVTNPGTFAATGVALHDGLPAGLAVAAPPNATNTCGGIFAPVAGATSLDLTGGSLAPGAACTFAADLVVLGAGTIQNVTDPATATGFPPGASASAALTSSLVEVPALAPLGLFALGGLLAGAGALVLRRRRPRQ